MTDLSNDVFPVSFTSNKVLQEDSKIQCFQKVQHLTNLKALSKGLLETLTESQFYESLSMLE